MYRFRLWLLALAVGAIVGGGALCWPDAVEPATGQAAIHVTTAGSSTVSGGAVIRGQRW